MDDYEKKGKEKEDIAEVIRKKLEAHKRQESFDYYGDKVKPLQQSTKEAVRHYHSSEHHPVFFTRKARKRSKAFNIAIIVFLLIIICVTGIVFYVAFIKDTQRELDTNFGKVIINDEETADLIINDNVYLDEVGAISVIFSDGDQDYFYNPSYVDRTYEISSRDLRLGNFKRIVYVSLFFEYNPEKNETSHVSDIQTTDENNVNPTAEAGSLSPFARFWEFVKELI